MVGAVRGFGFRSLPSLLRQSPYVSISQFLMLQEGLGRADDPKGAQSRDGLLVPVRPCQLAFIPPAGKLASLSGIFFSHFSNFTHDFQPIAMLPPR